MALRPIWWWFWLGWFPLFWFYPTIIDANIRRERVNGERTYTYYAGWGHVVAWMFFILFLLLVLFAPLSPLVGIIFQIIFWLALVVILIFWIFGIGHVYYFDDEYKDDKKRSEQDETDVSTIEGGEKVETKEDLQPMRMRTSRQMKSLNMQL